MKNTYIIGEIGQNHNGSVAIAKLLVELIARPVKDKLFDLVLNPIDAVKMTMRDLENELSNSQMSKPYNTKHSFGKTYGEHRAFLEIDEKGHFEVYKYAKEKGLDFIETFTAINNLSALKLFTPDYLKVASRDLTNFPLLTALAETKLPIIVSTGMAGQKELDSALNIISKEHNKISILHCVSEYPTQPQNVNLNTIPYLKERYPQYKIGYSDHTVGISVPVSAVTLGAEIIEKHITIDRSMKGTDQAGSLGPDGVNRMIRDIRLIEKSMGKKEIFIAEAVSQARKKLERSVATKRFMKKGEVITEADIHLLSPGDGFKWAEKNNIIGKKAKIDIKGNEIIYKQNIG